MSKMSEGGLILVDKEKGEISRHTLNRLKSYFKTNKLGYIGTLDPLATGLLVVGINKGLKLIKYLNDLDKTYLVEVTLGLQTDTLDITGKVIKEEKIKDITFSYLEGVLLSFKGKREEVVPLYSAIKVKGKRLYEYARNNEEVKLPKRIKEIKDIKLLNINGNKFNFLTTVSSGTYIRSLVKDIGIKIGSLMTLSNLRRIEVGSFKIEDSYKVEDIEKGLYKMISLKDAFPFKKILIDEDIYKDVKEGREINMKVEESFLGLIYKDSLVAIYKKDGDKFKADKVIERLL